MKQLLTILAVTISAITFGQTANDFLQTGIAKHKSKDYEGAIKDYSKAIKMDKDLRDAYFNRGVCEQALQDYRSAKRDFDKTIELDPEFSKVYYSRAIILAGQQKYSEALPDLDKLIQLDSASPNALTLRGQIRVQTGDKNGGCEDFRRAKAIGDPKADRYITQFCGNEQQDGESLMLNWPANENWKIGSDQEDAKEHVLEFIHTNETLDKWTELGSMTSIKGITGLPMDKAMNLMFEQAKQNSANAKLTFIEKDENTEYPWIMFTIEAPGFKKDKTPESQLWYIVQGKQALYTNFRAIKKAEIPGDLRDKWIAFFKSGKIANK